MNKEKRTLLQIEKLKDEKENLKFDQSKTQQIWLPLVLFLVVSLMNILDGFTGILEKSIVIIVFVVMIFGFDYAMRARLSDREKSIKKKEKAIQRLYGELLKNKEMKAKLFEVLKLHKRNYWRGLERHFRRHLDTLGLIAY